MWAPKSDGNVRGATADEEEDEEENDMRVGNEKEDQKDQWRQESRARRYDGLRKKESQAAKRETKKERLRFLNSQLPDNVHGMRNAVHEHCRFLLKIKERDLTTLPDPPNEEERKIAVECARHAGLITRADWDSPSKEKRSKTLRGYVQDQLQKLGLQRFCWDWTSAWIHPFNQILAMVFFKTFDLALSTKEYNDFCWVEEHNSHGVIGALVEKYFTHLQAEWNQNQKDGGRAERKKKMQRLSAMRKRLCERRRKWADEAGFPILAAQFKDPAVCSDTEEIEEDGRVLHRKLNLEWRSEKFTNLCAHIDIDVETGIKIGSSRKKNTSVKCYQDKDIAEDSRIPIELSKQMFSPKFLETLSEQNLKALKIQEVAILNPAGRPFQ